MQVFAKYLILGQFSKSRLICKIGLYVSIYGIYMWHEKVIMKFA